MCNLEKETPKQNNDSFIIPSSQVKHKITHSTRRCKSSGDAGGAS